MSVTIKDIARFVGVSYSTVAKALNDSPLVKPSTKSKIMEAAGQLGYEPNFAAKTLVTGKTGMIGAVWPSVERTFLSALLTEIAGKLLERGYTMLHSIHTGQESVRLFERLRVDAVLVFEEAAHRARPYPVPRSIPLLVIGKTERPAVSSIDIQRRPSMRLAVAQLASRGYRHIAYIGNLGQSAQQSDKYAGFREELSARLLPFEPDWTIDTPDSNWEQGYIAAKRLLRLPRRPQAIVSGGFDLTTGIVRALTESGIRIPEDVALVSYDNIPHMERLEAPVSAVGVPLQRLAQAVTDTLLSLVLAPSDPPAALSLAPEYVHRAPE